MSMVTVQATTSFSTYVAGDVVSVVANQMVMLPKDTADALAKAGYVLPVGRKAPETKRNPDMKPSRIVSDVVPDPDDITDDERDSVDDAATGRRRVDPSIARARKVEARLGPRTEQRKPMQSGEGKVAKVDAGPEELDPDGHGAGPEGEHVDPANDGKAAKGAYTTAERDLTEGTKPASKPVKTGQGNVVRKPKKTAKGKVADPDKPETEDPDGLGAPDPIKTVGTKEPKITPTGPKDDPAAGTEGKGDANPHPSPGTVK